MLSNVLRVGVVIWIVGYASASQTQQLPAWMDDDTVLSPPAIQPVPVAIKPPASSAPDTETIGDMLRRLNEAEAMIASLETRLQHQHETQSQLSSLVERWRTLGDPELELIDYLTRSAMVDAASAQNWYDRFSLRGYTQFRINQSIWEADDSAPPHHVGDRSVRDHQNFLIRRARLVLAGDVSDHMHVYLQPDFAATPPGSPDGTHYVQLRDWYADLYLDTNKVFRFRLGQSKVPYGWENMQSSSNRLPLDRNDALNSAVRNERDLGLFFYWTPEPAQDFFREVLARGLKGSGNYGLFGLGAYNGQGGSFLEQNDNLHVVGRITLPFRLRDHQFVELGAQAYTGKYTVLSSPISPLGIGDPTRPAGTLETGNTAGLLDQRVAGTFVWYPQPLGLQAEWNVGRGPSLNEDQTKVVERPLTGGYAMTMLRLQDPWGGDLFPFARWTYYRGGYKAERNAPYSRIDEWELGCEWQLNPQMEFTTMLTLTDRTNTSATNQAGALSYRQYNGHLLRFQFQINY